MPGDPRRTVERLVGPADPELGCDECFEMLDAYVELELAGAAADAENAAYARTPPRLRSLPR